jgi:hypothetical protein
MLYRSFFFALVSFFLYTVNRYVSYALVGLLQAAHTISEFLFILYIENTNKNESLQNKYLAIITVLSHRYITYIFR